MVVGNREIEWWQIRQGVEFICGRGWEPIFWRHRINFAHRTGAKDSPLSIVWPFTLVFLVIDFAWGRLGNKGVIFQLFDTLTAWTFYLTAALFLLNFVLCIGSLSIQFLGIIGTLSVGSFLLYLLASIGVQRLQFIEPYIGTISSVFFKIWAVQWVVYGVFMVINQVYLYRREKKWKEQKKKWEQRERQEQERW